MRLGRSSLLVLALVLSQGTEAFILAATPKTAFVCNPATLTAPDSSRMRRSAEGEGPRLRSHAANSLASADQQIDVDNKEDKVQSADSPSGPVLPFSGLVRQGELFVRSVAVFWTAARLFLDYKILKWRTVMLCTHVYRQVMHIGVWEII